MTSSPPPPSPPPVLSVEAAAEAARALGNAAFSRGAWAVACDHYAAAALGNPADARPRANAAAALLKLGRVEEASRAALGAERLEPCWPKAHWRVAEVCEASGDHEGAARAFERAVELLMEEATAATKEKAPAAKTSTSMLKKREAPLPFAKERRVAAAARLRAESQRRIEEAAAALDSRPRGREQTLVRRLKREALFSFSLSPNLQCFKRGQARKTLR